MNNSANILVFDEHDLISMDNIPDWFTSYVELDSSTGFLQVFNGTSKIPVIAGKHMFVVKLLGYESALTTIDDAHRLMHEIDENGAVVSTQQLQTIA